MSREFADGITSTFPLAKDGVRNTLGPVIWTALVGSRWFSIMSRLMWREPDDSFRLIVFFLINECILHWFVELKTYLLRLQSHDRYYYDDAQFEIVLFLDIPTPRFRGVYYTVIKLFAFSSLMRVRLMDVTSCRILSFTSNLFTFLPPTLMFNILWKKF